MSTIRHPLSRQARKRRRGSGSQKSAATSEDAAHPRGRKASGLMHESVFTKADHAIDCTTVLESQEVHS